MRPTRNALLNALSAQSRALLDAAEEAARSLGYPLWLVGGGVRDLAARRHLHDLDLAFAGDPGPFVDAVAARAPAAEVERTDRFGTAAVRTEHAELDLARLRTEHYVAPGALPEVRPTDRIEADLARRDFTVNAMALSLVPQADELVDPFEGLADLSTRRLRVLHDRSFVDDATRLWRGARTAALFNLEPNAETRTLIEEGARWIEEISGTRLWAEFELTADRGCALDTLERLEAWGVLRAIHPAFAMADQSCRALRGRRAMPAERLAAVLLAPLPQRTAILGRLNAPRTVRAIVEDTARLLEVAPDALSPEALVRLEGAHEEARLAARWLDHEGQAGLQAALRRWERTRPWLSANELRAEGVPEGRAIGAALRGLRRGRYLGTLNTPAEARARVHRMLAGEVTWD